MWWVTQTGNKDTFISIVVNHRNIKGSSEKCAVLKATGWTHSFKALISGMCSSFYTAIFKFLCLLLQQWVQRGGRVIEQAVVCAVYLE